ncbi:hypothetical protein [Sporosarcina sp. FSL W7-1283]|uniref:hypothetical protein n=1 Tax=Sporosarcina sp. FSL W7-1283 TaxID=2921560 RepID=UPI0030FC9A1B
MNSTNKKIKKINFFTRGWTDRAFIMTISVLVFFIFLSTGLIMLLLNRELDPMYLSLLNMGKDPLLLIVGSIFAIEGVEKVTDRKTKQEIESIVEKRVDDVDIGRDVSENVYGSIELENFDMNVVEEEYQEVYQDKSDDIQSEKDEDSGDYLV